MNVRKPEQASGPGYPDFRQFVKSVRQLGLAAFGAGAAGAACAAEVQKPALGGVPPPPSNRVESVAAPENQPPRTLGIPPIRLGGKVRMEPLDREGTTNDTAKVYDERWLTKNRKGKLMPGYRSDDEAGFVNPSTRVKLKKTNGWKKLFRIKNHA